MSRWTAIVDVVGTKRAGPTGGTDTVETAHPVDAGSAVLFWNGMNGLSEADE